jgi:hypothetical protein
MKRGGGIMPDHEKQQYIDLIDAQKKDNEKEYQRLQEALKEYNKSRHREWFKRPVRLTIDKWSWNVSRIQPNNVPDDMDSEEIQMLWSDTVKARRLKLYRQEFDDFAEFLKRKYFGESN